MKESAKKTGGQKGDFLIFKVYENQGFIAKTGF